MTGQGEPQNGETPRGEKENEATSAGRAPVETPAAESVAADRTEALEKETAELKERLLRTAAEMENLRRRTEREREETAKYAVSNFARDLLNVADNLRRALDAISNELRADAAAKQLIEGIEITERELLAAFEKQGIRKIDPLGEKFDHNVHQAMFETPDSPHPPGAVASVVQSGYLIKDRLLRPALVGVAKGEPKPRVDTSA